MKILVSNYTFDASAGTITFNDYVTISLEGILLIVNVTDNVIIYNFADPLKGGTVAGNNLTLVYDTSLMSDTDDILIYYDDITLTAATNEKLDELANHLDGVEGLLTTIDTDTGVLAGAVNGTEMQVDVVTLPSVTIGSSALPTGASTAANQATIISHVDGIETVLGTIDADTSVLAGAVTANKFQVDIVSAPGLTVSATDLDIRNLTATDVVTAELSATDNAVLDAIEADTTTLAGTVTLGKVQVDVVTSGLPTGAATSANQTTIIGHLDGVESTLTSIDDNTSQIRSDVTTLASTVVGTEVQVDVVTIPNVTIGSIAVGDNNIGNVDVVTLPALPAGTNNIGDVDVLSVVPGTGATNLGKAEDDPHNSGDVGVMMLGVRTDSPATSFASGEGDYIPFAISRYGQVHVLSVPGSNSRTATFTGTGIGAVDNVSNYPRKDFALQVKGTGAAATSWTVALQISADGTNYHTVLTHATADGDGAVVFITGKVARYYRANVIALTLGGATNISVTTVGVS